MDPTRSLSTRRAPSRCLHPARSRLASVAPDPPLDRAAVADGCMGSLRISPIRLGDHARARARTRAPERQSIRVSIRGGTGCHRDVPRGIDRTEPPRRTSRRIPAARHRHRQRQRVRVACQRRGVRLALLRLGRGGRIARGRPRRIVQRRWRSIARAGRRFVHVSRHRIPRGARRIARRCWHRIPRGARRLAHRRSRHIADRRPRRIIRRRLASRPSRLGTEAGGSPRVKRPSTSPAGRRRRGRLLHRLPAPHRLQRADIGLVLHHRAEERRRQLLVPHQRVGPVPWGSLDQPIWPSRTERPLPVGCSCIYAIIATDRARLPPRPWEAAFAYDLARVASLIARQGRQGLTQMQVDARKTSKAAIGRNQTRAADRARSPPVDGVLPLRPPDISAGPRSSKQGFQHEETRRTMEATEQTSVALRAVFDRLMHEAPNCLSPWSPWLSLLLRVGTLACWPLGSALTTRGISPGRCNELRLARGICDVSALGGNERRSICYRNRTRKSSRAAATATQITRRF